MSCQLVGSFCEAVVAKALQYIREEVYSADVGFGLEDDGIYISGI